MMLGSDAAEEALDGPAENDRFGDMIPLLPAEKRARIYAVLLFAYRADVGPAAGLDALLKACQRKNFEDKFLAQAVEMIAGILKNDGNVGEALGKALGRMLSAEEAAIIDMLTGVFEKDSPTYAARAHQAMETLLRLRELELLEGRRPQ